jgi:hypothetical protein
MAKDRVDFLEKKLESQSVDYQQDRDRLLEIIRKSMRVFKNFDEKVETSVCLETTLESRAD